MKTIEWKIVWAVLKEAFRAMLLFYKFHKIKKAYPEEYQRWIDNVGYEHKIEICVKHYLKRYLR